MPAAPSSSRGSEAGVEAEQVRCTEELAKPCRVPSMVCRSEEAARRAEKAAAFREAAEAEWRRELRK